MSFRYKKVLYHLLVNKKLIILSYYQILDCPENFVFDINLRYYLSKDKKFFLQKKVIKIIQKEIYRYLKKRTLYMCKAELQSKQLFKHSDLKDLIIKQIVANIIEKIVKIEICVPLNLKKQKETYQELKKAIKNSNIAIQFSNFEILNNTSLTYMVKIIQQITHDKKFIDFFKWLICNTNLKDLSKKASKFYKLLYMILFTKLDHFVLYLCKKNINKCLYSSVKKSKNLKIVEFLVSQALILFEKKHFLAFKKEQGFLIQRKQIIPAFYYIRYLSNIFFGFVNKSIYSNFFNLKNNIQFFCKSFFNSEFITKGWLNLDKKFIYFCGIIKKKVTQKIYKKKSFIKKTIFIEEFAPLHEIKKELMKLKIIQKNNKPKALSNLTCLYTKSIFIWYNYVLFGLIYFYKKTTNCKKLVYNLHYFFKWSLLHTLRKKHKKSIKKIVLKYLKKNNLTKLVLIQNHITFLVNLHYVYYYFL